MTLLEPSLRPLPREQSSVLGGTAITAYLARHARTVTLCTAKNRRSAAYISSGVTSSKCTYPCRREYTGAKKMLLPKIAALAEFDGQDLPDLPSDRNQTKGRVMFCVNHSSVTSLHYFFASVRRYMVAPAKGLARVSDGVFRTRMFTIALNTSVISSWTRDKLPQDALRLHEPRCHFRVHK